MAIPQSDLRYLVDALSRGRLALFIGGELPSALTGLPARSELAKGLAMQANITTALSLATVAQRIARGGNRWQFTNYLLQALNSSSKTPSLFHQYLAALPVMQLVTTCYDDLLKRAFDIAGRPVNHLIQASQLPFRNPNWPNLIQLYGMITQPETLVVTEDDHLRLWRDASKSQLIDRIRTIFAENVILLLGSDLSDPDFQMLWHEMRDQTGQFTIGAYAIVPTLPAEMHTIWEDRHIHILEAEPLAILKHLVQSLANQPVTGQSTIPPELLNDLNKADISILPTSKPQIYDPFELLVGVKTSDGYPATVTQSTSGGTTAICALDWEVDDFQKALRRIQDEDTDESFLLDFGRRLFRTLFTEPIATLFHSSLGQARSQNKGLRVRLRFEAPELAALPWEYLNDPVEDSFLAISPETPLVRYVTLPTTLRPLTNVSPLRILITISNPNQMATLDVQQEKKAIEAAFHSVIQAGLVTIHVLEHAFVGEINQAMRSFHPHVFHYIGHGIFQADKAHIILENTDGSSRPIDERTFREFFLGQTETRLVILNACETATSSSSRALTGLAPHLLQRNLAAVVAMQYPIYDSTALLFAQEFYRTLALGYPVDAAVAEARRGIFQEIGGDRRDWGTPVLFLQVANGQLFE